MKKIYAIDREGAQNEGWRLRAYGDDLISQAEAVVIGTATSEPEFKTIPDLDYLQVRLSIVFVRYCLFPLFLLMCFMRRNLNGFQS